MKGKVVKIVLVIFMIFALALVDFAKVGLAFVTYAASGDNSNIEFDVYFKSENGEQVYSLEESINKSDLKMFIKIRVKDKGYFNGKIVLKDSNFDFKDTILSEFINNIEGNTINLNQINANKDVELEVDITPKCGENIDLSLLNMESKISLNGTYKNENGEDVNVDLEKAVKLTLIPPFSKEEKWVNVESKLITNKVYEKDGQQKRVIQVLIKSNILNNGYPIKETNIELSVPGKPESVNVQSKGTYSTDGKAEKDFNDNNWEYAENENKVKIHISNGEIEGKINWKKNASDNLIVTYIYDAEKELTERNIEIKDNIVLYDNSTSQEISINQEINEEKDGIVNAEIVNGESSIYKGKIYSKEDREYSTTDVINVNAKEFSNSIELIEGNTVFAGENVELVANIRYIYTKFNKEQLERVLGENGYIVISDINGNEITRVNKDSESNEQGEIVINYANTELAQLVFKVITPDNQGKIEIINGKKIVQNDISKEDLLLVTQMNQAIILKTETKTEQLDSTIDLKNTTSKASLQMNVDSLSATSEGQNADIKVVLYNNSEENELFKNPVIEIELPQEFEKVEFKRLRKLYDNELKIKNVTTEEKKIRIELEGEQTKYKTNEIANTTLIVNADIFVNKEVETSLVDMKMRYYNENDNSTNETSKQVQIVKPIVAQSVQNSSNAIKNVEKAVSMPIQTENVNLDVKFGVSVGGEELNNGSEVKQGEVIRYTVELTNNGSNATGAIEVSSVVPEGTIWVEPDPGEMGSEHTGAVYYEEDPKIKNIPADLKLRDPNEVREFDSGIFDIETIEPGQTQTVVFEVRVKSDTAENTNISNKVSIKTVDGTTESEEITNVVKNGKIRVSFKSVMEKSIGRYAGGKPIGYLVIVENLSQEELKNVHVDPVLPEYTEISSVRIANEDEAEETNNIDFETLNPGETVSAFIYLQYKDFNEDTKKLGTYTKVTVDGGQEVYRSNIIVETVRSLNVQMEVTATKQNENIRSGDEVEYRVKITNNTSEDFSGVALDVEVPEEMDIYYTQHNDDIEEKELENFTSFEIDLKANSSEEIIIRARVGNASEEKTVIGISKFLFTIPSRKTISIDNIQHIITVEPLEDPSNPEDPDNPDNPDPEDPDNPDPDNPDNPNPDNPEDPDNPNPDEPGEDQETFSISGFAWEDRDENGLLDNMAENMLNGISVILLDTENNVVASTVTEQNGQYSFNNIKEGNYIVVFAYNNEKYRLTQYKATDNSEITSKVIEKELTINGETRNYSVTDTINLADGDINYINIGLVQLKTFDLELKKYISKVEIENTSGVKVYQFNNTDLAKVEIRANQIANSKITIEYQIVVNNVGEAPGYVNSIIDYLPEGYTFETTNNKGWTNVNGELHYENVENTIINSGNSMTVSLVLSKVLNENDTGIVNNVAEIGESGNSLGLSDVNSTPGNKAQGENDMDSADLIISIGTGRVVLYISLIITVLAILIVGIYFINRKVLKQ